MKILLAPNQPKVAAKLGLKYRLNRRHHLPPVESLLLDVVVIEYRHHHRRLYLLQPILKRIFSSLKAHLTNKQTNMRNKCHPTFTHSTFVIIIIIILQLYT